MEYKIILLAIMVFVLAWGCVYAQEDGSDTITIHADCKHIMGGATTNQNGIYLISTMDGNGYYKYITNDYMVSQTDYYKIKVGDTVTVKYPKDEVGYCEIVGVTVSNDNSWW